MVGQIDHMQDAAPVELEPAQIRIVLLADQAAHDRRDPGGGGIEVAGDPGGPEVVRHGDLTRGQVPAVDPAVAGESVEDHGPIGDGGQPGGLDGAGEGRRRA